MVYLYPQIDAAALPQVGFFSSMPQNFAPLGRMSAKGLALLFITMRIMISWMLFLGCSNVIVSLSDHHCLKDHFINVAEGHDA